jgi:DNA-binding MarR family transcriptional regulator
MTTIQKEFHARKVRMERDYVLGAVLKPLGLTLEQFEVLHAIAEAQVLSKMGIRESMSAPMGSSTRTTSKLEAARLVMSRIEGRFIYVALTELGKTVHAKAAAAVLEALPHLPT